MTVAAECHLVLSISDYPGHGSYNFETFKLHDIYMIYCMNIETVWNELKQRGFSDSALKMRKISVEQQTTSFIPVLATTLFHFHISSTVFPGYRTCGQSIPCLALWKHHVNLLLQSFRSKLKLVESENKRARTLLQC